MPTTHDDPISRRPGTGGTRPRRARRAPTASAAWPLLLLALVLVLGTWRVAGVAGQDAAESAPSRSGPTLHERSFGTARLDVPRSWVTLDRAATHVTWGDPARTHTVTLASTEASVLPLPGVVSATVEQSAAQLPGATLVEQPRSLNLAAPAARADSAMLARFRVQPSAGEQPLEVLQVWRRDSRAGLDLVATWTSGDGTWPVAPEAGIPRTDAAR